MNLKMSDNRFDIAYLQRVLENALDRQNLMLDEYSKAKEEEEQKNGDADHYTVMLNRINSNIKVATSLLEQLKAEVRN